MAFLQVPVYDRRGRGYLMKAHERVRVVDHHCQYRSQGADGFELVLDPEEDTFVYELAKRAGEI